MIKKLKKLNKFMDSIEGRYFSMGLSLAIIIYNITSYIEGRKTISQVLTIGTIFILFFALDYAYTVKSKEIEPMVEKMKVVTFTYKNWKGEVRQRKVIPSKIWFGKTEFHPTPQYLLKAYDMEKREHRDFALNDILFWGDKPVDSQFHGDIVEDTEEETLI